MCDRGFSALFEIRQEMPDVILSDLNMPGMSGFEFLSVVRRRFPTILVIAMSAAFSGGGVQLGVAADAFYEKQPVSIFLLQIMEAVTHLERSGIQHPNMLTPIWIQSHGHGPSRTAHAMCASLLAIATTSTLRGALASSAFIYAPIEKRSRFMSIAAARAPWIKILRR